jgi:RNA polymerase-binding transcription factor DksA
MRLDPERPDQDAEDAASAIDWNAASAKWCRGCGRRITDEKRRAQPGVQTCDECRGAGMVREGWRR